MELGPSSTKSKFVCYCSVSAILLKIVAFRSNCFMQILAKVYARWCVYIGLAKAVRFGRPEFVNGINRKMEWKSRRRGCAVWKTNTTQTRLLPFSPHLSKLLSLRVPISSVGAHLSRRKWTTASFCVFSLKEIRFRRKKNRRTFFGCHLHLYVYTIYTKRIAE